MMAERVRLERLFDEWDNDTDLAMVDLEKDDNSPTTPRDESNASLISRRKTNDSISSLPSPRPTLADSSRTLLRTASSFATTSDYEASKAPSDDFEVKPRQRNVFGPGMRRMPKLFQRTNSTFDGHFAHGRPGLWRKQMLVDRSLRSMAFFTTLCAIIMTIIVCAYIPDFITRVNKHTTSVGGKSGESCATAEKRNVAVHLFINIAATMILGCSNTYQQLITSLKVDEVRWVLSKKGDSKVGTNSPFSINHKPHGKLKSWLAWLLLISTSLPVHFLANSVLGPSFYIHMPNTQDITYSTMDKQYNFTYLGNPDSWDVPKSSDSGCWTAFRAGVYVLPKYTSQLDPKYHADQLGNSTTFSSVNVQYTTNCTQFKADASTKTALDEIISTDNGDPPSFAVGNCTNGLDVMCILSNPQPQQCRMNVRMQAAFILMGCLLIKATYMIVQNFRARFKTKEHLLTYGDVVVASVLDPDLKVKNECLLNSGDGWRTEVSHICHKHCKDPVLSKTGDTIGHCQKCKKFNETNKSANLPHPSIAIKYKRSLISNLGSNAIIQMLILVCASAGMLASTIFFIVAMASSAASFRYSCSTSNMKDSGTQYSCSQGVWNYLKLEYGTWGGFTSSTSLGSFTADSLGSEFIAFALSNGPQFLYSMLYLLLIYNITLISMEQEWGKWETNRKRPRCTIVSGKPFEQSYFLQLPFRILIPIMFYSSLMHWLLGEALSATETIYTDPVHGIEHSIYFITTAPYPIFISTMLMIAMTAVCWWAFTYTREGFIPQMYGSIRTCCASTTELMDFNTEGIQWGDLGEGDRFRHAGFSSDKPAEIIPAEMYCGRE